MEYVLFVFLILISIYVLIPAAFLLIYSIIGGIESLLPNKLTGSLCNYIASKQEPIENFIKKFYPFLNN